MCVCFVLLILGKFLNEILYHSTYILLNTYLRQLHLRNLPTSQILYSRLIMFSISYYQYYQHSWLPCRNWNFWLLHEILLTRLLWFYILSFISPSLIFLFLLFVYLLLRKILNTYKSIIIKEWASNTYQNCSEHRCAFASWSQVSK